MDQGLLVTGTLSASTLILYLTEALHDVMPASLVKTLPYALGIVLAVIVTFTTAFSIGGLAQNILLGLVSAMIATKTYDSVKSGVVDREQTKIQEAAQKDVE